MHSGVADADKTELLAREPLHRSQGDLQLILADHILPRFDLNSHNAPLVTALELRPEALIDSFPFALESMNVISG